MPHSRPAATSQCRWSSIGTFGGLGTSRSLVLVELVVASPAVSSEAVRFCSALGAVSRSSCPSWPLSARARPANFWAFPCQSALPPTPPDRTLLLPCLPPTRGDDATAGPDEAAPPALVPPPEATPPPYEAPSSDEGPVRVGVACPRQPFENGASVPVGAGPLRSLRRGFPPSGVASNPPRAAAPPPRRAGRGPGSIEGAPGPELWTATPGAALST